MPTIVPRRPVAKDRFAVLFPTLKAQTYHDPASRGPGSHTCVADLARATGSADRTLRIWNPEKPQVKNSTELRGHTGPIERVAWNPTKEAELASVSSDGTCKFWDVKTKKCTATVALGGDGLTIAWAADGSVVIVGRKDDHLIPITTLPTPTAGTPYHQGMQTNQATFNHTCPPTHLLLTSGDGSISILSYPSMNHLHTLHAHTSSCVSLALSPTARYLAIGGTDALISLYDTTDWVWAAGGQL
ncbi:THO complex subunit 3, partial [Lecanoromycetidae sp. Uapishka_2]